MIIDMRLRPPARGWRDSKQFTAKGYYPTRMGMPRARSAEERSMELLFREMDEAGVVLGVIMGRISPGTQGVVPNDDIAAIAAEHPRRFVWFAGVELGDPQAGLAEIERTRGILGCKGISIEPAAAAEPMWPDDQRIAPLYRRCAELGLPVSISASTMIGRDTALADPAPVHRVARTFPGLRIVLSHACWPHVMSAIGVAFACPNVYLSPDLYMNHRYMPGAVEFINAANLFMPDRLLWGSAYPSRPLKESVEAFSQWAFEPGVKERVLYHNAARLLGLE
ncbi:MAG: amidohydrolase [Chloroflexi bacterium]|nr:amidohydrolase [Chloroflexota bacterium]